MVIDDLQILISADAKGIESVLKKTIQTVTGTVNNINSQEVDWTSIFTASVSPAIIAGVASTFAFAITNAVQFQASLMTAGTAAGDTASQIAQVGNAALQTSTQVPDSAQNIADAMLQLSAVFSNVNDQQTVSQAMSELAASGFGNLNDIVSSSIQIFKDFGVTTSDQAIQVLTSLMHGAEGAKESIPALVQQFVPFDTSLVAAGVKVKNLNEVISTFASEVKNVGATNAAQIFQALATSSNNSVGPMELLGVNLNTVRKSLLEDGGLTAINKTSTLLANMGPSAQIIATQLGFSSQGVLSFQENSKKLPQISQDAKDIATNVQTITDAFKQSDNALRDFTTNWNTLKGQLIPIGDILVKTLSASLTTASTLIKTFMSQFQTPAGFTDKINNSSTTADTTPVSLITALNNLTDTIKGSGGTGITPAPRATVNLTLTGSNGSDVQKQLYNLFLGMGPSN